VADILDLLMFVTACALLLSGFPVAFTLAGTALIFALIGDWFGVYNIMQLNFYPQRMFGIMSNEVIVAAPLFIFMGLMLERSRVAEDLLVSMASLFRGVHGGMAVSVTLVGMLMAASTGIVGATVTTMGLIALPVMLKAGYNPALACGTICAAGTLGQIIPPSIVLVFLGDFLTYANQQANLKMGRVGGQLVSVGDLFAACIAPGLLLVALYIIYQLIFAKLWPQEAPAVEAIPEAPGVDSGQALLRAFFAPIGLIIAVLGSILAGVATPTEAAGIGAVGALLLAAGRLGPRYEKVLYAACAAATGLVLLHATLDLRIAASNTSLMDRAGVLAAVILSLVLAAAILISAYGVFRTRTLHAVTYRTARITAMVFAILIGASMFSLVFRGLGGEDMVHHFLTTMPGGLNGAMFFVMAIMFVMGFFIDFLEICFIVVPIVAPTLIMLGADPVWLGVMMAVNLQTSFLTPPFGFALFFLRGVAPPDLPGKHIYWGIVPFVVLQLICLAIIWAFPGIATFLPKLLYG
jgi:tripartite ATP-independent transporter DctM subunit